MSSRESLEAAEHEWERAAGVQLSRCERAEALVARYRAALEQIAGYGCRCDAGWGEFDDAQCPACVAHVALEEKR